MDPDANLMEQIALAKALVYELQAEEGMLTGSEGAARGWPSSCSG